MGRLETLRDLNGSQGSINQDNDYDKRSRSNAAEFGDGDDGARSAADFETGELSEDDDDSHHPPSMNDDISAPPQPQPSFASSTKSYAELVEENDILQNQLRDLQITQKHQQEVIESLRTLTQCGNDEYEVKPIPMPADDHHPPIDGDVPPPKGVDYDFDHSQAPPIVISSLLTQQLLSLTEAIDSFVSDTLSDHEERIEMERFLFQLICKSYLTSLPFGTNNQELLNTAYEDQIRRFEITLGSNFAKWYRRQTVQSLTLNPATKEYWQDMHAEMTKQLKTHLGVGEYDTGRWDSLLNLCAGLSLEIHGGHADVMVKPIDPGDKYDPEIMIAVELVTCTQDRFVKSMIRPLHGRG